MEWNENSIIHLKLNILKTLINKKYTVDKKGFLSCVTEIMRSKLSNFNDKMDDNVFNDLLETAINDCETSGIIKNNTAWPTDNLVKLKSYMTDKFNEKIGRDASLEELNCIMDKITDILSAEEFEKLNDSDRTTFRQLIFSMCTSLWSTEEDNEYKAKIRYILDDSKQDTNDGLENCILNNIKTKYPDPATYQ